MNFVLRVPGGGHRNLRVPDLYTSILRVPKATQTYSTCSDWRPSKNILPHVFLRDKLQFTCSTYDLPPPRNFECYPRSSDLWRHLMHVFLGEGAGAHLPHVFHIFPTCSTRCASVLRVPRLLPLLCAPSTLDADRTRRCAMVAHSPATAAKIVAGLVINMLPGLAIDLHPQNCATVRQGVTSAATHRQEQSQH